MIIKIKPEVSRAVCIPFSLHSLKSSNIKEACISGSPPEAVIPPVKKALTLFNSAKISVGV